MSETESTHTDLEIRKASSGPEGRFAGEKRPTENHPVVRESAARALLPAMRTWLGGDTATDDEIITDLVRAAGERDSYRMARSLEERGYDADGDLVEVMDEFAGEIRNMTDAAIKAWVEANGISPAYAVGEKVSIKAWGPGGERKIHDGVIAKINDEKAEYLVRVPELGHVAEGTGCLGYVIAFEDVLSPQHQPEEALPVE